MFFLPPSHLTARPLLCALFQEDRCSTCTGEICSCFHSAFLLHFFCWLSLLFFLALSFSSYLSLAFSFLSAFPLSEYYLQCIPQKSNESVCTYSVVRLWFQWYPLKSWGKCQHIYAKVWDELWIHLFVYVCSYGNEFVCWRCCAVISHWWLLVVMSGEWYCLYSLYSLSFRFVCTLIFFQVCHPALSLWPFFSSCLL